MKFSKVVQVKAVITTLVRFPDSSGRQTTQSQIKKSLFQNTEKNNLLK